MKKSELRKMIEDIVDAKMAIVFMQMVQVLKVQADVDPQAVRISVRQSLRPRQQTRIVQEVQQVITSNKVHRVDPTNILHDVRKTLQPGQLQNFGAK